MIKICRIDHRLLHGQVAFVWCRSLNADAILIVSDAVAKDEMRQSMLRISKPQGIKLVIKSMEDSIKAIKSGVTDKYKLFILVDNTKDALALVSAVEEVDHVNLGNMKVKEGTGFEFQFEKRLPYNLFLKRLSRIHDGIDYYRNCAVYRNGDCLE